jgi:hypothetical protein
MGVAKLLINYWIRDDCVVSDYQGGLQDDRLQLMLLAKTYNMYLILLHASIGDIIRHAIPR